MEKGYVCNRWPFFEIGPRVKFKRGLFVTSDPELQKLIESNDAYGVQIVDRETAEQRAAAAEVEGAVEEEAPVETGGGAVHGMRGTRPSKKK
jgi:hypothetical protein